MNILAINTLDDELEPAAEYCRREGIGLEVGEPSLIDPFQQLSHFREVPLAVRAFFEMFLNDTLFRFAGTSFVPVLKSVCDVAVLHDMAS